MKCPKCEKENNIQIISEYFETKEKKGFFFYLICFIVFGFLILLGLIYIIEAHNMPKDNTTIFEQLPSVITAIELFKIGGVGLALSMVFFFITPNKKNNRTKAVCINCGKTWYIEKDVGLLNEIAEEKEINGE